MRTLCAITLVFLSGFSHIFGQVVTSENHSKAYHLYFKADVLYPTMSLFSEPAAFGASIELKSPFRVAVQLNGIYAFTNSTEVIQNDIQVIPEIRYDIIQNTSRIIFTGIYVKYNRYQYKSYRNISGNNIEMLYYDSQGLGFGPIIGYQWHFNRISFEAKIGVGASRDYKIDIYENLVSYYNDMSWKLDYMAGINIGIQLF